jgi:hypothetical protein
MQGTDRSREELESEEMKVECEATILAKTIMKHPA